MLKFLKRSLEKIWKENEVIKKWERMCFIYRSVFLQLIEQKKEWGKHQIQLAHPADTSSQSKIGISYWSLLSLTTCFSNEIIFNKILLLNRLFG